ncbi:MAG: flagellar protein [Bdellovibrio sp.]|nr:flagellar protein [Bdellovibrio sp.]
MSTIRPDIQQMKALKAYGAASGNSVTSPTVEREGGKDFKAALQDILHGEAENVGMKLSGHAAKRIEERKLDMDTDEFFKLRSALDQLKKKGGNNSLVVTNKAAYIVDVGNDTIVTAIDKESMAENVFTKIDSTLFIN